LDGRRKSRSNSLGEFDLLPQTRRFIIMRYFRAKLHTDEELQWVDHSKTLREQNIDEDEELILRRKFFFSDTNVDTRDPVQLNLV
jgi:hypothetical protein